MNEVTPELIAQITSRLISELPGANLIPKSDSAPVPSLPAVEKWPERLPELASSQQVLPVPAEARPALSFVPSGRPGGLFRRSADVCAANSFDAVPLRRVRVGE